MKPYHSDNIFKINETGLFFKCMPNKTYTIKNRNCHGGKLSKARITLLVGANMSGTEKLEILVIGNSANPRCFKNIHSLPVKYRSNKKS